MKNVRSAAAGALGLAAFATAPPAAAEERVATETRAIFLSAEPRTVFDEFNADLGSAIGREARQIAAQRLTQICTGRSVSVWAEGLPLTPEALIGWAIGKIVKFASSAISAALAAELAKYTHAYEETAKLQLGDGKLAPGAFSLYTGAATEGGRAPALAVRCFRLTKLEVATETNAAGEETLKSKKLVADVVGLVELSPDDPYKLVVRPLRLTYVKPVAKSKTETTRSPDGSTRKTTPMAVGVSLKMGGSWREDNRIESNGAFFDVQFLVDKFTLETLAAEGHIDRFYGPGDKKWAGKPVPMPPSSRLGDDMFGPNAVMAKLSVVESGAEPQFLRRLQNFFEKHREQLEGEAIARLQELAKSLKEE